MYRLSFVVACLMGAVAVALGAVGAHVLRTELTPAALETFNTAVHYLLVHALALVGVAAWARGERGGRLYLAGTAGLMLGTVLFSGGLLGWTLAGFQWARQCAPWGGTLLILAWCTLALAAIRARREQR